VLHHILARERARKPEMSQTKDIAMQRIRTLFELAKENIRKEPELAQRYAQIARRIAMRTRVKLPTEYRRLICRHCKSFIYPGVNSRVRVQRRRQPHVVITCQVCGKAVRIPLREKTGDRKRIG
jgi:ribonuclease P protein subunit RPR2